MRKLVILVGYLILAQYVAASSPQKIAFREGEKLKFVAAYQLNFIWVPAGEATLSVRSGTLNNRNIFIFDAVGSSLKSYDWFFKVRNKYYSYADQQTMSTYYFERNANEGNKKVLEKYTVNQEKNLIYSHYKFNEDPLVVDTLVFKDKISDGLTAAYSLRNYDFSKIKKDDKIYMPIVIDNKLFPLYVRYMGKDVIISHDKHLYNCHKFSALVMEGTMFKGGEDVFVWVSDDENHVPVQVEAKILVGSVKIQLVSAENLANPFKAFIK